MKLDLLIKGGRVIDPSQGLDARADVGVARGRIEAIGNDLDTSMSLVPASSMQLTVWSSPV